MQHNTNFPPCRMVVGVDTSLTSNGSEVHGIYVEYEYDISHQVLKEIVSFFTSVGFRSKRFFHEKFLKVCSG